MSNILYVTSFNKDLFKLGGDKLIQSFLTYGVEGKLLITYEDDILSEIQQVVNQCRNSNQVLYYNLSNDEFLKRWLQTNEDIIPKTLGGKREFCNCVQQGDIWRTCDHIKGCPSTYFNHRASQWFRKIVALNYAITLSDIIVFIDADIVFYKTLRKRKVIDAFKNCGVFYHLGEIRRKVDLGIESGFIGFRKKYDGFKFLNTVINTYKNGNFRQYYRWDDGYIFKMTIQEHPEFPTIDLVKNQTKPRECIEYGPFYSYLIHFKGKYKNEILDKSLQLKR